MVYERRGGEVLVNTTTADHQDWAQITFLADGRFVIVWRDRSATGPDPLGHSIRGQLYNADGSRSGGEFLVNTITAGSQTQPTLFALPTGGFVVAWTDSNDSNIRAQIFDAAGAKSGDEIAVNGKTAGVQSLASGAVLADGSFVLTWTDQTAEPSVPNTGDSPIGVRGRRFDASGAPINDDFAVNTHAVYEQSMSKIAALPGGGYVIVWRDLGTKSGIVGQMFNADGTKAGVEFMVSTVTANTQSTPSIATLAGGGFIVTWTDSSRIGGDSSYSGIKGQLFDAAGVRVGGEFLVNTHTSGYQDSSSVTATPDGGFVAVWTTTTTTDTGDGDGAAARGQFFDASGARIGEEFLINVARDGDQYAAGAAVGPDGVIFVTMDLSPTAGDGSGSGVKLTRFIVAPGTDTDDTLDGTEFADTINGFAGNDIVNGLAGDDILDGGDGDDMLTGGEGFDRLDGGAGSDTLVGGAGGDLLAGAGGDDTLDGGDGDDDLLGEDGNDTLSGGAGHDLLDGGMGIDILDGGAGDDLLYVNTDVAGEEIAHGGTGTDILFLSLPTNVGGSLTHSRSANPDGGYDGSITNGAGYLLTFTGIERFNLSGTSGDDQLAGGDLADILIGIAGADTLYGHGGNDQLIGGAGDDILVGGAGDDVYHVSETGDIIVEDADGGLDQVQTTALVYTLSANVETLRGLTNLGHQLTGNASDNTISSGDGNDILDGGAGADRMFGYGGNDVYIVDNAGDTISENIGTAGGTDEVRTALASLSLATFYNVENLTGTSDLGQTLTGNDGVNIIRGGSGDDILDGGAGQDRMEGGAGNDTYYIDNSSDEAIELADGGIDEVVVSNSHSMGANVENARAAGNSWSYIRGNALDNVIRGGDWGDILDGGAGADTLIGGKGADRYTIDNVGDVIVEEEDVLPFPGYEGYGDTVTTSLADYTLRADLERLEGTSVQQRLVGNDGANHLSSGGGNDTLIGGKGNDSYSVYAGDTVVELEGEGTDAIYVNGGNWTLGDTVERLSGQSSSGQILTGNRFDNYIDASSGSDVIDGAGGADTMLGGAGNDIYYVDDAGDTVLEAVNSGTDEVRTALEIYTLSANVERFTGLLATGQIVTGNSASNLMTGAGGNDVFFMGQGGTDVVKGGGGDDAIHFGNTLTQLDQVDGGAGNDLLTVQGPNINATLAALSLVAVETIAFLSHSDTRFGPATATPFQYRMVTHDATVAAGALLAVDASGLTQAETLDFNGSAETNGRFAIQGGAGADILRGGSGNDMFVGGAGNDQLFGGAGSDSVDYSQEFGGGDVIVNLQDAAIFGAAGKIIDAFQARDVHGNLDSLSGIENVKTGVGNDSVYGDAAVNRIETGAGNDLLMGGAGADTLIGGSGDDVYSILQAHGASFEDSIVELEGEGIDEVATSLNAFSLAGLVHVENLRGLSGTGQALTGNGAANRIVGGSGDDIIEGGGGNDLLNGGDGTDTVRGGAGDDVYVAVDALDAFVENEGEGTDQVQTALLSYTLAEGSLELLTGTAPAGGQALTGNSRANLITGTAGADRLDGGGGIDTLRGLDGNDDYHVDDESDVVVEAADQGFDAIHASSKSFSIAAIFNTESLIGTRSDGQSLTGNSAANSISGGSGGDLIDGGAGADAMYGGEGDDVFIVDDAGDAVYESGGQGTDEVRTALSSYTLSDASVEKLTGLSQSGQSLTGNALANSLTGNAGDDMLDGGAGADAMAGGLGDDIYVVDGGGDIVAEAAEGGHDEVRTALGALTLAANVEKLTGISDLGQSLTGNASGNVVTGAAGDDVINGGGGDDRLIGGGGGDRFVYAAASDSTGHGDFIVGFTSGSDKIDLSALGPVSLSFSAVDNNPATGPYTLLTVTVGAETMAIRVAGSIARSDMIGEIGIVATAGDDLVEGTADADELYGLGGDDILRGFGANDRLDGGTGADAMAGGLGDDIYVVDQAGDVVTELAGEGIDTVRSAIGSRTDYTMLYVLPDHVENFVGTAAAGQGVHGNAGDNVMTMGAGNDLIVMDGGGIDSVLGGGGNDYLYYGATLDAQDVNDGGAGFDTIGLFGVYDLTLGAGTLTGIEKLVMYSSGDAALPNSYSLTTLDANVAAGQILQVVALGLKAGETLTFFGHAETDGGFNIQSGAGHDTLVGGRRNDSISGGAGNDLIYALNGDDQVQGGAGDDQIYGGGGNDRLAGGAGRDLLNGGFGDDVFVYAAAGDSTGTGHDVIHVFDARIDRIDLAGDAAWNGSVAAGTLSDATFDADLAAAVDGLMQANGAVLFTPDAGDRAGRSFAVIDANGDGAYSAGADYVIEFTSPLVPLTGIDIFV